MRTPHPVPAAIVLSALLAITSPAATRIIRVGGDGGLAGPVEALDALAAARAADPGQAVDVVIANGTYRIDQALVLDLRHGGTPKAPVRWIAAPGAAPVISGGVPITGFTVTANGLWTARLPAGSARFDQLWVNGRRATRARHPNSGFLMLESIRQETLDPNRARQSFTLKPEDFAPLAGIPPQELAGTQFLAYHKWDNTRRSIESLAAGENRVNTVGKAMKSWNSWDKKTGIIFENFRAALDQPGEWFLDAEGTLIYQPRPGEDPATAEVIAPRIPQLLVLKGGADKKLTDISFQGIRFRHTGWVSPPGGFEPQQAAASIEAVIQADNTQNITIENCEIAHTGIYGVWFRSGCSHNSVRHCHLHDLGAGGIRSGSLELPSSPAAATSHQTFDNNILQNGGKVFPCAVGVWIGHSGDNRIIHNDIGHFPYTGISLGWRWGYDRSDAKRNLVENNHIHHIGDGLLSDMGAVYTLGPSEGTIIRGNHIHDVVSHTYGGWGLYNDEGSTGIVMENNLVHHTKSGGYHQHYGKENTLRNNILAFATEQQIQYTRAEEHLSFRITGNIILWEKGALLGGNGWKNGRFEFANNLYWRTDGTPPPPIAGDTNSRNADPLFANPQAGDWSLPENSPALALGFKPFDPAKAGVYGHPAWINRAAAPAQATMPSSRQNGNSARPPARAAAQRPQQALPDTIKATLDIPYAETSSAAQRLDLYLPAKPQGDKPLPLIVFIHGGAWQAGNKAGGRFSLLPYVSSGNYAGASVGYRLSHEATWPAQIEDCKAAIRWLRAHAKENGIDPEKIAVWGPSAGGHLVAMLGVSGGVKELEGSLGKHLDQSSRVTCVADYFGPTNLLTMGDFPSSMNHNSANSPESRLIGGAVQEHKDKARNASPATYVSGDDPPFFIAHGTSDPLVPFNQSETFAAALGKAGVPIYLQTVEDGGHGGFEGPELNDRLKNFFDKYLRGIDAKVAAGNLKVRE
jgi:acetyl esterase/lipase